MSIEFYKAAIQRLLDITEFRGEPEHPSFGICFKANEIMKGNSGKDMSPDAYDLTAQYAETWAHYSGDENDPIPRSKVVHEERWEGNQLELRRDLMCHILREIEQS